MPKTSDHPLSLADKTGIIVLIGAAALLFPYPYTALLCLAFFLLLCCCAPFFSAFGFFLPIISRGKRGTRSVAITFDDGPSPLSTPIVLALLDRYQLKATFFLIGTKAARYPDLVAQILGQGHTIGNHSWEHDSFLMLRSRQRIEEDISKAQQQLTKLGAKPRFFRPPVGVTGPRLWRALRKERLIAVSSSCRAYDRGNRNVHNLADKILRKLGPGKIILLHDLPPIEASAMGEWQQELDKLLQTVSSRYEVAPLEEIVAHNEVPETAEPGTT